MKDIPAKHATHSLFSSVRAFLGGNFEELMAGGGKWCSDFNYEREPNDEERHKFSRDIYRVEDSHLVQAVEILEKRCPEAVVRVSMTPVGRCCGIKNSSI